MTAPAAPADSGDRVPLGMGRLVAFYVITPLIDVFAKLATKSVPAGTVTLARFVVQATLMLALVLWRRLPVLPPRGSRVLSLWRALFAIGSTLSFVAAVRAMPIADALAIAFVEPFVILLIGKLVLREEIGPRRLGAAVVGSSLYIIWHERQATPRLATRSLSQPER